MNTTLSAKTLGEVFYPPGLRVALLGPQWQAMALGTTILSMGNTVTVELDNGQIVAVRENQLMRLEEYERQRKFKRDNPDLF